MLALHSTLVKHKDDLAYHMTEHLRMNGVYWGLVALCIMDKQDALDRAEMIRYVMSCWDEEIGESRIIESSGT